ncbi:MAG TPA: hypothetical protein VFD90_04580 [Gaiellales bacterium]|nr:hypothetical protein [Gaiellales bacterium]
MTPVAAPSGPTLEAAPPIRRPTTGEPTVELERVARGLRGARARTHLSEAGVVAILSRQGVALTVPGLRRCESTGVIALALASCLADIYGTTTDGLAGRRFSRRASLNDFQTDR